MVTNEKMYYKQDSNCSIIIQIVYLYRMGEWDRGNRGSKGDTCKIIK